MGSTPGFKLTETGKKPMLDWKINPGNIITLLLILVSIAIAFGSVTTRLNAVESTSVTANQILVQLQVNEAQLTEITKMMDRRLTRLEDSK